MNASVFYEKYLNASAQELAQNGAFLQDLARRYPWFSLGRLLLFKSLCGLGGEASLSESEKTALYVYSRSMPYFILQESLQAEEKQAENEFFTLDLSQEIEKEEAAPSPSAGKQDREGTAEYILEQPRERTFYPGADYFGKADMANLELDVTVPIDRFISDKPRFVRSNRIPRRYCQIMNLSQKPLQGSMPSRVTTNWPSQATGNLFCYIRKKALTLRPLFKK